MNQLKPIEQVLLAEDYKKIESIKEELVDAWHKRQIFRTKTEARYGVLNDFKFPTKASKYWQAVREQCVHLDELTALSFEIRRKEIKLKEIDYKLNNKTATLSEFDREKLLVDRDECVFHLTCSKAIAHDRVREIMQWSEIKKEVNDGSFDDKNVDSHQKLSLYQQVFNRKTCMTENTPTEEKLSIDGIINSLQKSYQVDDTAP